MVVDTRPRSDSWRERCTGHRFHTLHDVANYKASQLCMVLRPERIAHSLPLTQYNATPSHRERYPSCAASAQGAVLADGCTRGERWQALRSRCCKISGRHSAKGPLETSFRLKSLVPRYIYGHENVKAFRDRTESTDAQHAQQQDLRNPTRIELQKMNRSTE